jgi:hypothetical protein
MVGKRSGLNTWPGKATRFDVNPWDRTPLNPKSNLNLSKKVKNQVKKL